MDVPRRSNGSFISIGDRWLTQGRWNRDSSWRTVIDRPCGCRGSSARLPFPRRTREENKRPIEHDVTQPGVKRAVISPLRSRSRLTLSARTRSANTGYTESV